MTFWLRARRPLTLVGSLAVMLGMLTTVSLTQAPQAEATNKLSKNVGFNARVWTVTQPDAQGVRYIGGDFTSFDAWQTGNGAWASLATGAVDPTFPAVSGEVYDAAPDGQGGWVIAGSIGSVDGVGRNRLARVDATGTVVASFAPPAINHEVNTIAVVGNTVLIGGLFTAVDGQTRNRLAALDLATGALLSWDPNANSSVFEINVINNTIYIGGEFTTMSGQARTFGAALRADARTAPTSGTCIDNFDATDCLTGFAPALTGLDSHSGIFDFEEIGGQLYIGGRFNATSGATTITGLARVDAATGALDTTWDPALSGNILLGPNPGGPRVYAMEEANGVLYVGGKFTSAGGQSRLSLAAYDIASGGTLTAWAPTATPGGTYNSNNNVELGGGVNSLQIVGSTVYLGGGFFSLNGTARNRLGAVDLATGATTAFNPHPCDWSNSVASQVRTVSVLGTHAFFGGNFPCAGGLPRYYAAAVGPDGILTDWTPEFSGAVTAMSSDGSTVYAVGKFTTTNGAERRYASAVQTDGTLTAWNPTLSTGQCGGGEKQAVLQTSGYVYVGGCFTTVGGVSRVGVAATDRTTGAVETNFNANVGQANVRSLAISGSRLYLGGMFTTVAGQNRGWVAAVDKDTGALDTNWNPGTITSAYDGGVRQAVQSMEASPDGSRLYIGGWFGAFDGVTQRYLAALDAATGALDTTWAPVLGTPTAGGVFSLDLYDDTVYVAGVGGTPVIGTSIGAVSAIDGSVSTWMNSAGGTETRGITASDAAAFIGGSFGSIAGGARGNSAAIDLDGTLLAPWPMDGGINARLDVSITASGQVEGAVVSNPGGINCGASCEYGFTTGTTVTLTAVPRSGADFAGWTGSCTGTATTCTVAVTGARSAVAAFVPVGTAIPPSPAPNPAPSPAPNPEPVTEAKTPSAPQAVTAQATPAGIVVTWQAPLSPGSFPITTYRVTAQPGGQSCLSSDTSCTFTGLDPDVVYTFVVSALNGAGWSPASQQSPSVAPLEIAFELVPSARIAEGRYDRIRITGRVTGLAEGTILTPWFKKGSARTMRLGKARIVIQADGSFQWTRRVQTTAPMRVFLRVRTPDGIAQSPSVSWKPIRHAGR